MSENIEGEAVSVLDGGPGPVAVIDAVGGEYIVTNVIVATIEYAETLNHPYVRGLSRYPSGVWIGWRYDPVSDTFTDPYANQ